jgi:hypothetical protein
MNQLKPNPALGATVMEVVENQIRNNDPPETQQTFKQLLAAGHSEKEAKRLIACVVSAEIFDVLKHREPFNRDRFMTALGKLPAIPWDEGK